MTDADSQKLRSQPIPARSTERPSGQSGIVTDVAPPPSLFLGLGEIATLPGTLREVVAANGVEGDLRKLQEWRDDGVERHGDPLARSRNGI